MREYVKEICEKTARTGFAVLVDRINLPSGYRDGAVVAPLDFEPDEFCGILVCAVRISDSLQICCTQA